MTMSMNQTYNATHQTAAQTPPDEDPISIEPPSPTPQVAPQVYMLAVPKSWTRLMIVTVSLLFIIVGLVSYIVYINYRIAKDNTERIIELRVELENLKTRTTQSQP